MIAADSCRRTQFKGAFEHLPVLNMDAQERKNLEIELQSSEDEYAVFCSCYTNVCLSCLDVELLNSHNVDQKKGCFQNLSCSDV